MAQLGASLWLQGFHQLWAPYGCPVRSSAGQLPAQHLHRGACVQVGFPFKMTSRMEKWDEVKLRRKV